MDKPKPTRGTGRILGSKNKTSLNKSKYLLGLLTEEKLEETFDRLMEIIRSPDDKMAIQAIKLLWDKHIISAEKLQESEDMISKIELSKEAALAIMAEGGIDVSKIVNN